MPGVGDYRVICDRSGFKCWASETVVEWNGLRVLRRFSEARHPQDFVRATPDDVRVSNPRPEAADSFLSSTVTAADL
jgi:hypothetical protein